MQIPTSWSSNTSKNVNVTQYSSSSVTYSSSTQNYVSPTVGKDAQGKVAAAWIPATHLATSWSANVNYGTNEYLYDDATIPYDSASYTYDGVNGNQSPIGTKPATAWSRV